MASFSLSKPYRPVVNCKRGWREGFVCPLDRVLTYKNLIYLRDLSEVGATFCKSVEKPVEEGTILFEWSVPV